MVPCGQASATGKMHADEQRRTAPRRSLRVAEESAMKASDLDGQDVHLFAHSVPPSGGWLRVVGVALAVVLICAIWTFWA